MSNEITFEILQNAARSASRKYERPDLEDDVAQELWFEIDALEKLFDPEIGSLESLVRKHAYFKLSMMVRKDKEHYVDDIYGVQREVEDSGGEIEVDVPEDDIIVNIDKNTALDKIRQKLLRNGRNTSLQVVQTYKDKIEGRKTRKKLKGRHDSPKRQKLARLESTSGVSRARFATALGMTPQRYQSLIDGTVKEIPDDILERAENVVIEELPVPLSNEEMVEWCGSLLNLVPIEGATIRRKEEFIANIVTCSRTTVTRWRTGKTRLMPEKASGIKQRVVKYINSIE